MDGTLTMDHLLGRVAPVVALMGSIFVLGAMPPAVADNSRLNNSVAANIYAVQRQHGCTGKIRINAQLQLAAQSHADDLLTNHALGGDMGSDGSSVLNRAIAVGYTGTVAETVAINPALAINNLDVITQWYNRPDYMAIMTNCAYTQIGVWSENSLDRSVVVAVYGQPV